MQISGNNPKLQVQLQQIQESGSAAGTQKAAGSTAAGNGQPAAVKDTFVNAYPVTTRPQAQTAGECVPLPRPRPDIYPCVLPRPGSLQPHTEILPGVLPRPGSLQPQTEILPSVLPRSGSTRQPDPGACVMPRPVSPQMQNKLDEWVAQRKFNETVKSAKADGWVTHKEQRHIDAAGRDLEIAKTRVELDQAREAHRAIRKQAVQDGKITPEEGEAQMQAWSRIESLQRKLEGLEITDKVMGAMDKLQEQLEGSQPPKRPWNWCKTDEFTFPPLPDFPKPPRIQFDPSLRDYGQGPLGRTSTRPEGV
jgi:hypothetical protein